MCLQRIRAYKDLAQGGVKFVERGDVQEIWLPCGQCMECRIARARAWAVRCVHEASLYPENSFITLTYDDANMPYNGSLVYHHFQDFMKRLRKRTKVRFFMCGEYGERYFRPHYHACIFGYGFPDRLLFRASSDGRDVFTSNELAKLWPMGFSTVGDVTLESAAYVAGYVTKKVSGVAAEDHYKRVLPETGELVDIEPEFTHMSLKPGIGARWFQKFHGDVRAYDRVVQNGRMVAVPKYYDKLWEEMFPADFDEVKADRELRALEFDGNEYSESRCRQRGEVIRARLALKKRTYED